MTGANASSFVVGEWDDDPTVVEEDALAAARAREAGPRLCQAVRDGLEDGSIQRACGDGGSGCAACRLVEIMNDIET